MRMIAQRLRASATAAALLMPAHACAEALPIGGDWLTEGARAAVRIGPCADLAADSACGAIVWLWDPHDEAGRPRTDAGNPDVDRRGRPLIGTQILSGFSMKSPGHWTGGRIYNPEDGRTYEASIRADGAGRLTVEGCVLFICRKQHWLRRSAVCAAP